MSGSSPKILKTSLLIQEPPLQVLPSLAKEIGLNNAIVLQQLHWLLENKNIGVIRDGYKWVFNTHEEWQEKNFTWWSTKTIQRIFTDLEKQGLVVIAQLDKNDWNMRNFYRIDYNAFEAIDRDNLSPSKETGREYVKGTHSPDDNNSNTESPMAENEEEEEAGAVKIKTSLLLSKIYLAIDPNEHGTLTISDEMRKKSPVFVLGWLGKTCHDKNMRSPIGFLTNRLKGETGPDVFYINNYRNFLPDSYLEAVGLANYVCSDCTPPKSFKKRDIYNAHIESAHPFIEEVEPKGKEVSPSIADDSILQLVDGCQITPMQAWDSVLEQIKPGVSKYTFDEWLRDTSPIRWGDFVMQVGVEKKETRDILEDRYTKIAQRLLVGILKANVTVQFVATGS